MGNSMCGASSEQKQAQTAQANLATEQTEFYKELLAQQKEEFAPFKAILDHLSEIFKPILDKGIDQEGYTPEQKEELNTIATEDISTKLAQTRQAVAESSAAEGGGNEFMPEGAKQQVQAEIDTAAQTARTRNELAIDTESKQIGRQNFFAAAQELGQTAGMYNPVGFAGAATGAGSAASSGWASAGDMAKQIQEADDAWMGPVFGAVGGILGSFAGNPAIFGGGKRT